jgi:adenylosuccinate synthase
MFSKENIRIENATSRDTTVAGCLSEAGIPPSRVRKVVMVCRTYPIRVESPKSSTSGPMGTEIDWRIVSKRSRESLSALEEAIGRKTLLWDCGWWCAHCPPGGSRLRLEIPTSARQSVSNSNCLH